MEEALIMEIILKLHRRYRLCRGFILVCRGLLFGIILASVLTLFSKITGFFQFQRLLLLMPIPAGALAGYIYHRFNKTELMEVALKSDGRLSLKERLSTALEWIKGERERTPMFRGLLRDTADAARSISPVKVFPFQWKDPLKRLGASAVVLGALIWMPVLGLIKPVVDPAQVEIIGKGAKQIEKIAKNLEKKKINSPAAGKKLKKAEKKLKTLARDLKNPAVDKREALIKISRVQDEMKSLLKEKDQQDDQNGADRKSPADAKNNSEEEDSKFLSQLSKTLNEIKKKSEKEDLTKSEKEELEKSLEKLRQQAKQMGHKTESIEKAMQSAKNGDLKSAAKELENLSDQFQKRQQEMEGERELAEAQQQLDDVKDMISSGSESPQGAQNKQMKEITGKDGKGKADFGNKSTNLEVKEKEPPGNTYTKRQSDKKSDRKGFYQKIYDPKRDQYKTATGQVKGQINSGPVIKSIRTQIRGAPRTGAKAFVDPVENYVNSRAQGEEAVRKDKIPSRYRDLVKGYYDDIDPR